MSWITEKLLGLRRVISGVETLPERGTLEFAGDGVTVTDDTANKRTVVTIAGGAENALDLSENPPTEAGQFYLDEDGRLWGWSEVWAAASPLLFELEQQREYDDRFEGGATDMAERALSFPDASAEAMTVTSAIWVPEGALAANANHARIVLNYRDVNTPGAPVEIMANDTSVIGWSAFGIYLLGSISPGLEDIPAGCHLSWSIQGLGGAPPTCPAGKLFVRMVRTAIYPF